MSDGSIVDLLTALSAFVDATEHQSQAHIRPLHEHIASRLVVEGGFLPTDISPRPPFRAEPVRSGSQARWKLHYDPSVSTTEELTLLGGLKTKKVDVVVAKENIGPCLAISVKGTTKAFRNLTNRMEEAAGDCTNLHIAYPALVYGFLHVLKAIYESDAAASNDIAIYSNGQISNGIQRYHDALVGLSGRQLMRDDVTRYEAATLALIDTEASSRGRLVSSYPPSTSPLAFERFFLKLYDSYDLRFVYAAPALKDQTQRVEWHADSPALPIAEAADLRPRIAN